MSDTANAPGLTTRMELYDSEILKIEGILDILNSKRLQRRSFENFTNEIKERFLEIGLVVSVVWYEMGEEQADGSLRKVEGSYMPEIVIKDRVEGFQFDHDQMKHEIVNNILGMPDQEKGQLIKATPEDFKKLFGGDGVDPRKHHH